MSTTIEYKNEYGRSIGQQQAEQMNDFFKIIKINGIIRYSELHSNNGIEIVSYYKESGESYEQAYLVLKQQYIHASAIFIHQRTFYGNYTIENTRHYLANQDIFTENRSLLDTEARIICWENQVSHHSMGKELLLNTFTMRKSMR